MDSKLAALQSFEDIDDSLSNISTVSDDSEPDSGYDHSNWVSKLAALSEIEESDYEVVPRLNWPEVHNSSEEQVLHRGASVSSLLSNDSNIDIESVSNPNEMISRAEWDQILRSEPRPLDASLVRNLSSVTTTATSSDETLKERKQHVAAAVTAGSSRKHHHLHNRSSTPNQSSMRRSKDALKTTSSDSDKERTSSWLSNIFRKNTNPGSCSGGGASQDIQVHPERSTNVSTDPRNLLSASVEDTSVFPDHDRGQSQDISIQGESVTATAAAASTSTSGLVVIAEVAEIKATVVQVSRSFDDNSEFERAEECAEDVVGDEQS